MEVVYAFVARIVTRIKAHEQFPEYFDAMRDAYDVFLAEHFSEKQSRGNDIEEWLMKYDGALGVFIGAANAQILKEAVLKEESPPTAVLQAALSNSHCAATIFSKQIKQMCPRQRHILYIQVARMPRLIQHKSVRGGLEWGGVGWNGVERGGVARGGEDEVGRQKH